LIHVCRKQYVVAFTLLFAALILTGCSSSSIGGNSAVQITPTSAFIAPGQTFQFSAVAAIPNVPNFLWEVNGVVGGSPSTGTITTTGVFTAPSTSPAQPVQIGIKNQLASAAVTVFDPNHVSPGSVAETQNPLVAAYSISVPFGASVCVQFGTDTTYGLSTSGVAPPATGGTTTVLVAGMLASTTYHLRAVISLPTGSQATDADQTFTTGAIPASALPSITTQLTGGSTPSAGVELLSLTSAASQLPLCAVATDLAGNVIWYYPLDPGAYPFPIKLLPNGHMMIMTGGTDDDVREVDLAGNIIQQITFDQINQSLAKIVPWGIAEFSHDFLVLPNAHIIILANLAEPVNNVPGVPEGTEVTGNAIVDWDPRAGAVWTWSTFDHLDLTRAPYGISDWTHGNALVYSPDDGNLLFSMRNQNWVIKIKYQDGAGDGSILWRFGPGGDFTLPNQEAPIEWNYGQHYPTIQSPNSTGIFTFMFFDNGNNRLMNSSNQVCGSPGVVACYSSVPIFQLNEYTMTANVMWESNLTPAYSVCCGDALILPNGNIEYDVAYNVNTPNLSYIEEVTQSLSPELVWRMNIEGQIAYRGMRIPSLYPDQVWPTYAQSNVRKASGTPIAPN
jgi:arylsulfate sulfotransferase